jgi:hypothetical protein
MTLRALAPVALLALAGCMERTPSADCEHVPDLRAMWHESQGVDEETGRRTVVAYITDCGILDGARRAEVRRMLGRDYEREGREISYYVGEDGMRIDEEALDIRFDRHSKVVEAVLAQH